jgi:hypothetical protein
MLGGVDFGARAEGGTGGEEERGVGVGALGVSVLV